MHYNKHDEKLNIEKNKGEKILYLFKKHDFENVLLKALCGFNL